jgi:hypothetical protein
MKKKYSRPMLTTEEYLLNQVVAGACAGGITVINQDAVQIGGTVHCYEYKKNQWNPKGCSDGAHTWGVQEATIFADGSSNAHGCTTDIYTRSDYDALFFRGSTISGHVANVGGYSVLHAKGNSDEHLIRLDEAGYSNNIDNYFRS